MNGDIQGDRRAVSRSLNLAQFNAVAMLLSSGGFELYCSPVCSQSELNGISTLVATASDGRIDEIYGFSF